MSDGSPDEGNAKRGDFFCGVVEGFYGRPWTTEQRKDLFQKLKKWNMDMYVYAPKDDYKHRAYWRELYTVEEAEHLTSLISAAKEQGITFCYALSPGLDITYSSQKEITALKRKLDQVAQFGCTCFALLFDDIEPEMSEADKQIFQTFAHAQVSVTNEVVQHLGSPRFLLCPTQYCAARAAPNVRTSEYLTTLGTKLAPQIDIMWTGSKVISKTITTECIEEITQVLRRPPVIWDNLHANDYDQKRIFLGPYCGRSPSLIPLLRGVLTNPNIEYNSNLPGIRTLAHWATCSRLATPHSDAVSWDIKLERESEQGVCEDELLPSVHSNVYHPRQALRQAIEEWLPEFSIPKSAQDPVIKPQPPVSVAPVPIIPILPSVNTCMTLTSSTTTAIPTVRANMPGDVSQAETVTVNSVTPVMNSLVSATKVVVNESIPNPIIPLANSNMSIPSEIPVSTLPVPVLGLKLPENGKNVTCDSLALDTSSFVEDMNKDEDQIFVDDEKERNGEMSVGETPPTQSPCRRSAELDVEGSRDVAMTDGSENGSMQVEASSSPLSGDMMVETSECAEMPDAPAPQDPNRLTTDDLVLLCDLFYLPFEHGSRALRLLNDYYWLITHTQTRQGDNAAWSRRRSRFLWWVGRVRRLCSRLYLANNKELKTELSPYLLEMTDALSTLQGLVRWLELGKCSANLASQTQATYTWFSKGWREAFESGAQEPWVFRGGVISELRRLLPADCGEHVTEAGLSIRPYVAGDESQVCALCLRTYKNGGDGCEPFPADLQELLADRLVQPFLTLCPEYCMVIEDDKNCPEQDETSESQPKTNEIKPEIVSYACAALDCKDFYQKMEIAWIPEMKTKYAESLLNRNDVSQEFKDIISELNSFTSESALCLQVYRRYPSLVWCAVPTHDTKPAQRVLAVVLAALTASGSTGAHVAIPTTDRFLHNFYTKLGFTELLQFGSKVYLGRAF